MKLLAAAALLALAAPSRAWEIQDRSKWRCYGNEQTCAKNPAWADSDLGRVPMDREKVRIIVHHTADSAAELASEDPQGRDVLAGIYRQHKARKWATIGYHFVIDKHGRVWEARPVDRLGAHVTKTRGIGNEGSIGISVVGDFEQEDLTRGQFDNLKNLIAWLTATHKIPLDKVITHQHVEATACPGRNLYRPNPGLVEKIQPRLPAILAIIARSRQPQPKSTEQLIVGRGPFARVIRN